MVESMFFVFDELWALFTPLGYIADKNHHHHSEVAEFLWCHKSS